MSKQLVEQVKAALVARGQKWETNEDAFQITGRVAWLLRGEGAMLISKQPGQNGANTFWAGRVSHDAIAFPTGWKDVLVSAGPELNVNGPAWDPTGSSTARLIEPFDLDAGVVVPPVVVPPVVPVPPAPPTDPAQLDRLEAAVAALHRRFDDLMALPAPTYDVPYDIKASWPVGNQKGTFVMTPRKR
jgi:hypothetical protein